MAIYNSLLLECGGGIIDSREGMPQRPDQAVLVIGLGGQGVAALTQLRCMMRQQLQPDDPESDLPKYQHIQLLGIATPEDRPDVLPEEERLGLHHSQLYWGTGGTRLVGHQLLAERAQEIYAALRAKVLSAALDSSGGILPLKVYLFAGLSGGLGSCFMDICYILKKVLDDLAGDFSAQITGLFFGVDVALCKPGMVSDPDWAALLRGNEQAALGELNASKAPGWRFHQEYGSFYVDTNLPPVDDFYLISPAGEAELASYDRAISRAAEQVLEQLHSVPLPRSREFYRQQSLLYTDLAVGFVQRFRARVGEHTPTKEQVQAWETRMRLDAGMLWAELWDDMPPQGLPSVERNKLRSYGIMEPERKPDCWLAPGRRWLEQCAGLRVRRMRKYLEDQQQEIFRTLCDIAKSPTCGPRYAAALLDPKAEYSLLHGLRETKRQVEEERESLRRQLQQLDEKLVDCSVDFCQRSLLRSRRQYDAYFAAAQQCYDTENRLECSWDLLTLLEQLEKLLQGMHRDIFEPLCVAIERLGEVARCNDAYLGQEHCVVRQGWTNECASCIGALTDSQLTELVDALLGDVQPGESLWEEDIPRRVSAFMTGQFHDAVHAIL